MSLSSTTLPVCLLIAAAALPLLASAARGQTPDPPAAPEGAAGPGPGADPAVAERIGRIQEALAASGLDGWLFYDFRGSDPLAARILMMPAGSISSRRWMYFVPASGAPAGIVHAIEPRVLDHLPGTRRVYRSWVEYKAALREALAGRKKIAMQYSPEGALPTVARVDAGTIELVRKAGPQVVGSADLVQMFEAVWTPRQREQHERAAVALREIVAEAWSLIGRRIRVGAALDERVVQQHLWERIREKGMEADHPPIVAAGANAANPHYETPGEGSAPIRTGDLVLIDIWAKLREPGAVYADITWMGAVVEEVPDRYVRIWNLVRDARDAALQFVRAAAATGKYPAGWEVDDVARGVIFRAGFGPEFLHRTGHSIGEEVHGNGANLDNLETHDERRLLPGTGFSIEPGIYLVGEFGIRSEIDVYLDGRDAVVTGGPAQEAIVPILAGLPGS